MGDDASVLSGIEGAFIRAVRESKARLIYISRLIPRSFERRMANGGGEGGKYFSGKLIG